MSRSITWRGGTLVIDQGASLRLYLTEQEARRLVDILERQFLFFDADDIDIVDVTLSRSDGRDLMKEITDMLADESRKVDWRKCGF